MTQQEAFEILKTGADVFLTGEPGSGKTHLVNRYVAYLRERSIAPAITASTGIAATHIGGMTIHSWSGIGIKSGLTRHDLRAIEGNKRAARRIANARVLIIDEVSMLSAQTLDMVDAVCRAVRGSQEPFGGMQVILVGDFFQLPPIVRRNEDPDARLAFANTAASGAQFAYESAAWRALVPTVCYLSEQYRQEDAAFLEILSALRAGSLDDGHKSKLLERGARLGTVHDGITKLFSHNSDVDRVNERELAKLAGEEHVFKMESRGQPKLVEQLKRGCLSPETLRLKVGAKVMFTKNSIEGKYANGTTGTVVGFRHDDGLPVVATRAGRSIIAEPDDWKVEIELQTLAAVTQIPLRLAWAITVHKSQGMSLDAAAIDLSAAFEYGQGYVALSRLRTLAGLHLLGLNERALEVHPDILAKDAAFRAVSDEALLKFRGMDFKKIEDMQRQFIRACGGNIEPSATPYAAMPVKPPKPNTYLETLALVKNGKTVFEIAAARSFTEGTIIAHLEKLQMRGDLPPPAPAHIARGSIEENEMRDIHAAMRELGAIPLKPVFDHFDGRIPYDILRLARLTFEK